MGSRRPFARWSCSHGREIEDRLATLTRGWAPGLARVFTEYRRNLPGVGAAGPRRGRPPYWLRLPGWLLDETPRSEGHSAGWLGPLSDLLWAQFCLYLSVRVRDDLLDGQAREPLLVMAAEELLDEAERVTSVMAAALGRELGRFLRRVLHTTREAILEVDALQCSPRGMPESSLVLYARVGAIFKFGSWVVLCLTGRLDTFARVSDCCDHLAMGLQILDDLRDLEEDCSRGRLNFAASLLLGPDRGLVDPARVGRLVAERLCAEGGLERVCARARSELRAAGRAIEPLAVAEWSEYLNECLAGIDSLESELHRGRVDAFFSGM